MKKQYRVIAITAGVMIIVLLVVKNISFHYGYIPSQNKILNTHRDVSKSTDKGDGIKNLSSESEHQVKVDQKVLSLGKETFYKQTFGNEVFMTDILGILDGPITFKNMMAAVAKLNGKGTTNLRVPLASDITIGKTTFHKGDLIDTGLDVPKGSYAPLGVPISYDEGKVEVGISCAACHATVDHMSKNVIEGAPNNDFNLGLLVALASNSTAYFTHVQVDSIKEFITNNSATVTTTNGNKEKVPDHKALEEHVDRQLLKWPRGAFDSTIDKKANPAQIPDSFTIGDFPYGWSGFAQVGPFHGLSTFNNNVHAQNTDALSQYEVSQELLGIDPEVYLATILQNAANPKYRYDYRSQDKPSVFFKTVDPTPGVPGVNELVRNPSYPKVTAIAPDGLIASSPGHFFNEENNAMSAWQNTIVPPKPKRDVKQTSVHLGEKVFSQAGCMSCHAGNFYTNNRIVPTDVIGTEPSRAQALKSTEKIFGSSLMYSQKTPVPLPDNPKVVKIPDTPLGKNQLNLGFSHGGTKGGYKTPSLNGLYWSAPYLHDGGVAVGKDASSQLGVLGTINSGIPVDPENSLRALIDRKLRQKVINANVDAGFQAVHVTGQGHKFWVDNQAGFTKEQQDALIDFLFTINK